jgi:hypothetical protein
LDSALLSIAPVAVKPIELLRAALKIFEAEAKRAEVKLELIEDKSLTTLGVNWVMADSSRTQQIRKFLHIADFGLILMPFQL